MGWINGVSYYNNSGLDPNSISWSYMYSIGSTEANPSHDSHNISLEAKSLYFAIVLDDDSIGLDNVELIAGNRSDNNQTIYSLSFGFTAEGASYSNIVYTYILKTGNSSGSITLESSHIAIAKIFDTNS